MAWTDTFTDIAWANGDYGTELKFDQAVANDRYLLDQSDYVNLPGFGDKINPSTNQVYDVISSASYIQYWYKMRLVLNTSNVVWTSAANNLYNPIGSAVTTEYQVNQGNSIFSGIAEGSLVKMSLQGQWSTTEGGSYTTFVSRDVYFTKTQAIEYMAFGLSWRPSYPWDSGGLWYYGLSWEDFWAVGHRESTAW